MKYCLALNSGTASLHASVAGIGTEPGDEVILFMPINIGCVGPYPSGVSGIFIDAVARLGINARFIGTIVKDDFGELII